MRPAKPARPATWGAIAAGLLFALVIGAALAFLAWLFVPLLW